MTIAIDYRMQYEAAEERIRELEGIISRAEKQELEELIELRYRVEDLEQSIAKAREILEQGRRHVSDTAKYTDYAGITRRALDALEEK